MIIINLKGGLGNQMFQYAFGRALAIKNTDTLKLDTSNLSRASEIGNTYRPFSLNSFNIKNDLATAAEIAVLKKPEGLIRKIKKRIRTVLGGDPSNSFKDVYLNQTGDLYLDGYWQSPLFFQNIRENLLTEFTLKLCSEYGNYILEQIKSNNSISVHIRRGDYIKRPVIKKQFGPCSANYYKLAIDRLQNEVLDGKFFVFSDDIAWVKDNIKVNPNTVFVSEPTNSDAEELFLMSKCKHNIIANSSFSWWAAWLNQNPDKIVIAPTPWFDKVTYDKDLIPDTWIQLAK